MQVAKWGNSLAVRLPIALVQELGISDGDELVLKPARRSSNTSAQATVERLPTKLERLHAARKLRAPWPTDFSFDRDAANAR